MDLASTGCTAIGQGNYYLCPVADLRKLTDFTQPVAVLQLDVPEPGLADLRRYGEQNGPAHQRRPPR